MVIDILDDDPRRMCEFKRVLGEKLPDAEIVSFDHAPGMIDWLGDGLARAVLVSLDHDLGAARDGFEPGTGREVADAIASQPASCPVIVHSSNSTAAQGMVFALEGAGWTATRAYPMN